VFDLYLPDEIKRALDLGATLAISISGGKDSQCIAKATSKLASPDRRYALHCDLGRAEWPESLPMCHYIAAKNELELVVTRRPQGDLVQEIEDRMHKLAGTDKPFWPSSASRYCTSDHKRDQADKELRKPFWPSSAARYCTAHHKTNQADKDMRFSSLVISVEGIRAQESTNRAKKSPISIRQGITSTFYKNLTLSQALDEWEIETNLLCLPDFKAAATPRLAINWYPIFEWPETQVYEYCGHSIEERNERRAFYREGRIEDALAGWFMHPAYIYGNDRVSCALCILASQNDLRVGATHHPELFQHYINLEEEGGATFKNGWSLKELL
jgi:3'-phosphoadenosine 5'-phosphosulfate sulfotransferase (PAPS reductase)/FAD synthetase